MDQNGSNPAPSLSLTPHNGSTHSTLLNWIHRLILLIVAVSAAIGWMIMFARWLADFHPVFDLASHMSFHVWSALTILWFVSFVLYRRIGSEIRHRWFHRWLLLTPPWIYFLGVVTPWVFLPLAVNDPNSNGLKILSFNIRIGNRIPDSVASFVRQSNCDVVVFVELGNWHMPALKQLENEYPFCKWLPTSNARGIAVLSKVPGTEFRELDLANEGMPAIEVTIPSQKDHRETRILASHTRSPDFFGRTLERNSQLAAMTKWVIESKTPSIVIGDLNITPWSPPFQRMLIEANLQDTRLYRGVQASWPSDLQMIGIPIDHALVSPEFRVRYRAIRYEDFDSDHFPLFLTVE